MARPLPLLLILLCLLACASPASAQGIRRCVDAQGMSIFTDRPCSEMNAVAKEAPPASEGNLAEGFRGGFSQRGCARRPEELLERVRGLGALAADARMAVHDRRGRERARLVEARRPPPQVHAYAGLFFDDAVVPPASNVNGPSAQSPARALTVDTTAPTRAAGARR